MPIVNLTDAYVRTLKCEAGRLVVEVRDKAVQGLELRASSGGRKSWRLHYTRRSDGRRRVVKLGSYPSVSLKTARRRAKELQVGIEDEQQRADPAGDRAARRSAETFAELADDWLERHAKPNKRESSWRGDSAMLQRHIVPAIGAMKAAEITKRDVLRLLDTVAAKPDARRKPGRPARKLTHQPNRVFELVRAIFRWGLGRDLLKIDPTWGLSPPIRKERPRERELSFNEIRTLWAALDRTPVKRRYAKDLPRGKVIVKRGDIPMTRATALTLKLALATAQRIGEVACIAMSELDLNEGAPVWTIPGRRSKNGQPNRVPLSPLALRIIREARSLAPNSAWLFPSANNGAEADDGPIYPHAPSKALVRARSAINLPDFRLHDLRRTSATRMAELGVSPYTISLVLNHISAHKGTITSKVYVQYSYDKEKRQALDAWGAKLEEELANSSDRAST